jgi:Protein of unknown function (DUF2514)
VKSVYLKLGALFFAVVLLAYSGHMIANHYRDQGRQEVQTKWDQDKLARAAALQKTTEAYRIKEQIDIAKLQKAEQDHAHQLTKITADANNARATANSLRDLLASNNTRLPTPTDPTSAAANKYTRTVSNVLAECADRYRAVAESADRHAADAVMLRDAWSR